MKRYGYHRTSTKEQHLDRGIAEITAYCEQNQSELEKALATGRKKFVRYEEGARLYSMGLHSFEALAREAGAVYHVKRVALVNTDRVDEYLENFRDEQE